MSNTFTVQTKEFEGPLDVLLSLIKKRKLFINDISLAQITGDYLSFIKENQESLSDKTEFLHIATTLVWVKSKSLLPNKDIEGDQQDEINELEDRLRAYKLIKKQAGKLRDLFGETILFTPTDSHEPEDVFAPGDNLTTDRLARIANRSLVSLPQESLPTAELEKTVSLREEIGRLNQLLSEKITITFEKLRRSETPADQTVSFVALLELAKAEKISVNQKNTFAEITIKTNV